MMTKSDDLMMNAWKRQIGTVLRCVEAVTEEARKMRELQLTSAVEAHASAVATREQIEKAADAQELLRIQREWWSANLNRSLAYWRETYEGAVRTQASIARCLGAPVDAAAATAPAASDVPLLEMMGQAYKRWLEASSGIYAASARPATSDVREAA